MFQNLLKYLMHTLTPYALSEGCFNQDVCNTNDNGIS